MNVTQRIIALIYAANIDYYYKTILVNQVIALDIDNKCLGQRVNLQSLKKMLNFLEGKEKEEEVLHPITLLFDESKSNEGDAFRLIVDTATSLLSSSKLKMDGFNVWGKNDVPHDEKAIPMDNSMPSSNNPWKSRVETRKIETRKVIIAQPASTISIEGYANLIPTDVQKKDT